MCYIILRTTVADYKKWRSIFDENEPLRRSNGAIGGKQIYYDFDNPNSITTILEWDKPENAIKFSKSPQLAEVMAKAGVIGKPTLVSIVSRA